MAHLSFEPEDYYSNALLFSQFSSDDLKGRAPVDTCTPKRWPGENLAKELGDFCLLGNTYLERRYSMFWSLGASENPDFTVGDLPEPFFTGGNSASL